MTLSDLVTTAPLTWIAAQRVNRLMRQIRRKYVGQPVTELMPNGAEVAGVIVEMAWDGSVGLEGGWCVLVRYDVTGYQSWTSDTVLTLGSK